MSLWSRIVAFVTYLVSRFFAWRYDTHKEPAAITAKRRELIDTLPRGCKVLEIGAGTGASLSSGLYQGAHGRFSALALVEPDAGMRERLVAKMQSDASLITAVHPAKPVVVDAALPSLPFEDDAFDAIVTFFVLSHVDGRPEAMKELARVLKPGGKLLFLDHGAHEHHEHHHHKHTRSESSQSRSHSHGFRPFFMEWFRFAVSKRHHPMSIDVLVREMSSDSRLELLFERRFEVDFFFKEAVYGCYERK